MTQRHLISTAVAAFLATSGAAMACTSITTDTSGQGRVTSLQTHGCVTVDLFARGQSGKVAASVTDSQGTTRILAMGDRAGGQVQSRRARGDLTIVTPMCADGRPALPVKVDGGSGLIVARCR